MNTRAEKKDYYAELGLDKSKHTQITQGQISAAYRLLANQYHPDKNKDPSVIARMKDITEAFNVLKDSEQRRQYDYPFDTKLTFGVNYLITPDQLNDMTASYKQMKIAKSIFIKPLAALASIISLPFAFVFLLLYRIAASLILPIAAFFSKKAEATLFAAAINENTPISNAMKFFTAFISLIVLPFIIPYVIVKFIFSIPNTIKLTTMNLSLMMEFAIDKMGSAFTRASKDISKVNLAAKQSYISVLPHLLISDKPYNVDLVLEQGEQKVAAKKSHDGILPSKQPANETEMPSKVSAPRMKK